MRRVLLPLLLAAAISLTPARAQAGVVDDFFFYVFVVGVAAVAVGGTAEVLTGIATAKNYRSWRDERDPSAGWVGVGGVGGLLNVGLGTYLFVDGLPSDSLETCHDSPPGGPPRQCPVHTSARTGQLIFGTILTGFGAFSLTMAIQAARTSAPPATGTSAAPLLAPVGFMLPPIRF